MTSISSPLCQWLKNVENKRRKEVLHEMTKTLLELKLNENGIKSAFKQLSNTCKVILERCDNEDDEKLKRSDIRGNRKKRKKLKVRDLPLERLEEVQQKNDTLSTDSSNCSRKIENNNRSTERLEEEKLQRAIYDSCTGSSNSSNRNTDELLEDKVVKEFHSSSSSSKRKIVKKSIKWLKRESNSTLDNQLKSTKRKSDLISIERQEENKQRVVVNSSEIPSLSKTSDDIAFERLKETVKRKMLDVSSSFPKRKRDDSLNLSTLQVTSSTPAKDLVCRNVQNQNLHSKKEIEVINIESDDDDVSSTRTISDCNIADKTNLKLNSKEVSTTIPENLCDSRNSCNKHLPDQNKEHLSKENRSLDRYPFPQTLAGLLENKPFLPRIISACRSPLKPSVEVERKENERPIGFIKVKDPASLGINVPEGLLPENALSCEKTDIAKQNPNTSSSCDNQPLYQPNNVTYNVNTPTGSGPCNVSVGNNNISIYLQMGLSDIIEHQLQSNGTITKLPNHCSSNSSTDLHITKKSNVNSSEACSQVCSGNTKIVQMNVDEDNETLTIDTGGSNQNTIKKINLNNPENPTIPQSQSTLVDEIIRSMQNFDHTYTAQKTPNYSNISKPSTSQNPKPFQSNMSQNRLGQSYSILKVSGLKMTSKKKASQAKKIILPNAPFKTYSRQTVVGRMPQHNISNMSDLKMSTTGGNNYDTQYCYPSFSNNASVQTELSVPRKTHDEIQCSTQCLNKNEQQSVLNMNPIIEVSQPSFAVISSSSMNLPKDTSITDLSTSTCSTARNIETGHNTITSQPVSFQSTSRNAIHSPTSTALYSPALPTKNINSQPLIIAKPISEESQNHDKTEPFLRSILKEVQLPSGIDLPACSTNSNYKLVNPVNIDLTQKKLNPDSVTDNTLKSVTSVSSINTSNEHSSSITTRINSTSCEMGLESTPGMKEQQSLHHSNFTGNESQRCSSTYLPPDSMLSAAEGTAGGYNSTNSHVDSSKVDNELIESGHASAINFGIKYPNAISVLDELDLAKIQQMYQKVKAAIIDNAYKEAKLKELGKATIFDLPKYARLIKHFKYSLNVQASTFVSLFIRFLKKSDSKGIGKKKALMLVYVKILEHFLDNNELEGGCKQFQNVIVDLLEAYNLDMEETDASLLSDVLLVMRLPAEVFDIAIAIAATTVNSPITKCYDLQNYDLSKYSDYIQNCIQRLALVQYLDKCSTYFALQNAKAKQKIAVALNSSTKKLVEPSSSNSSNGNTPASLKKLVESSSNNSAGIIIPVSCPSLKKPIMPTIVEQSSKNSAKNVLVSGSSLRNSAEPSSNYSSENNTSLSCPSLKKPGEQSSKYSVENIPVPVPCLSLKKPVDSSSNSSARNVPVSNSSLKKPVEASSNNPARNVPVSGLLLKKSVESSSDNCVRNIPVSGPSLKNSVESSNDSVTIIPVSGPSLKKPAESSSNNSATNIPVSALSLKTPVETPHNNSLKEQNNFGLSNSKLRIINAIRRKIQLIDALPLKTNNLEKPKIIVLPRSMPSLTEESKTIVLTKTSPPLSIIQNMKKQLIQSNPSLLAHSFKINDSTSSQSSGNLRKNSDHNQSTISNKDLPSSEMPVTENCKAAVTKQVDKSDLFPVIIDVRSLQGVDYLSTSFDTAENLSGSSETNTHPTESSLNVHQATDEIKQELTYLNEPQATNITVQESTNPRDSQATNYVVPQNFAKLSGSQAVNDDVQQKSASNMDQNSGGILQRSPNLNKPQATNITVQKSVNSRDYQATNYVVPQNIAKSSGSQATNDVIQEKSANMNKAEVSSGIPQKSPILNKPQARTSANSSGSHATNDASQNTAKLSGSQAVNDDVQQKSASNMDQNSGDILQRLPILNKPQATNITVQKSANSSGMQASHDVFAQNTAKLNISQAANDDVQQKSESNMAQSSGGIQQKLANSCDSQSTNDMIPQKSASPNKPQASSVVVQETANLESQATNAVPQNTEKLGSFQAAKNEISQNSTIRNKTQASNIMVQKSSNPDESHTTNNLASQSNVKCVDPHATKKVTRQVSSAIPIKPQVSCVVLQNSANPDLSEATKYAIPQESSTVLNKPLATKNASPQESSPILQKPQASSVVHKSTTPQESSAILNKPEASRAVVQELLNPSDSQATKNFVIQVCSPPKTIVVKQSDNLDEARNVVVKVLPCQPGENTPSAKDWKVLGSTVTIPRPPSKDVNPSFKHNLPQQLKESPHTSLGNRLKEIAKPLNSKGKLQPRICESKKVIPQDIQTTIQEDIRNTLDQRYDDASASLGFRCLHCERSGLLRKAYIQCSVCKTARYCDAICQGYDWIVHKKECFPFRG